MPNKRKSVLVVAGESSGEQHVAHVIRRVNQTRPGDYSWFGSGGSEMEACGVQLLARVEELSAIGPVAAFANLGRYLALYRSILAGAKADPPDLAVLVDFPDFNLRLAKRLKRLGIPVCYFIGPQLWAWRPSRVRTIRATVARMLVILPFEVDFYRRHGVTAHYVGNPVTSLRAARETPATGKPAGRAAVALLPGSRAKEIELILPLQLEIAARVAEKHPARFFVIAAPDIDVTLIRRVYQQWRRSSRSDLEVQIERGGVASLLPTADCAMIKSGTTTLQATVLGVPFVMVYRMSELSYRLLRPFVRTSRFCLANLVADEEIVPEFVQHEADPDRVAGEMIAMLQSPQRLYEMKQKLRIASERLGTQDAYSEAACEIVSLLEDTHT